ncbi:MAG TPA: hypothetical protein VNO50_00105 [Pyrinomonadaceae bacterium]|nr:hypothetical protein [Pyrinomonadaceae bacterium]
MRKSKRVLFKTKVFGFNPYGDQIPAIKQIMEETAQQSEAPVLRMLIDEALWARRRKAAGIQAPQQAAPAKETEEKLETIQELLLTLIRQGETALRMESVNLELLQETVAEARAGRIELWDALARPAFRERGKSPEEIAALFEAQTAEGQDYAYGLAEEIGNQLLADEAEAKKAAIDQAQPTPLLLEDDVLTDGSEPDFH